MWHCGSMRCAMHSSADQRCAGWTMAPILRPVGRGTVNEHNDVRIIQGALNRVLPNSGGPAPKLKTDGFCGSKTIAAIEKLQAKNFSWKPDGVIEPAKLTIGKLIDLARVGGAAAQVSQSASGGLFSFPLDKAPSPDWNGGARFYGAKRSNGRLHAGCDLLGTPGSPIYAISDGVLVRGPYQFTGPKQNLAVTDAVEIRHGQYLIRYGEIAPGSYVGGKTPTKGSIIAKIGALRMLHFEMYSNGASIESLTGTNQYKRRADGMNPGPLLDQWVKNLPGK